MNDQNNYQETVKQDAERGKSNKVNIQPSEPKNDSAVSEENAPGRTPGKSEGSTEIIEADLEEKL